MGKSLFPCGRVSRRGFLHQAGGGFFGVATFEVVFEAEGDGFGGEDGKGLEARFGRTLDGAGADEDVVDGVDLEEDFGVADERVRADIEAVALKDGADEGAEVDRLGNSRALRGADGRFVGG